MTSVLEVRPGALNRDEVANVGRALDAGPGVPARLIAPDGAEVVLPEGIHDLLLAIVRELGAGNGVTVIPMHAELTTVEAADLLNVSRPYLIKQLEAGALPHHMVGTHRRLRLADVLAYRDQLDNQAAEALAAMTAEAEDLGLYDE